MPPRRRACHASVSAIPIETRRKRGTRTRHARRTRSGVATSRNPVRHHRITPRSPQRTRTQAFGLGERARPEPPIDPRFEIHVGVGFAQKRMRRPPCRDRTRASRATVRPTRRTESLGCRHGGTSTRRSTSTAAPPTRLARVTSHTTHAYAKSIRGLSRVGVDDASPSRRV